MARRSRTYLRPNLRASLGRSIWFVGCSTRIYILNLSILRSQLFQLLGKGQPKCERVVPEPSLGLLVLRRSQFSSG
jgi:hypothetical protein